MTRLRERPLLGSMFEFQDPRRRLEFLNRVARECGDLGIFHIGPVPIALANSLELIQGILVDKGGKFTGGDRLKALIPFLGENSLLVLSGERHLQQRRLNQPAFRHQRLIGYSKDMVEFADEFQRSVREGEEISLTNAMTLLFARIAAKTLLNIEPQNSEKLTDALAICEEYVEYLGSQLVTLPLFVPTARNRRYNAAFAMLREEARRLVEEWRKRGQDNGDFLSMLLLARDDDGTAITDDAARDHALTMYMGGHETGANAMSWCLYLLMQHPEVEARLREEVDSVLAGRKPTHEDLPRLPYTLQVLKETLRL